MQKEKSPVGGEPSISPVVRGFEKIYERFVNGSLIYRPTRGSDKGKIVVPIRDLANPLEGTFDLFHYSDMGGMDGDMGKYLGISTGYRKRKRPENAIKVEIWFAPRFLIEEELKTTAKHFEPIYGNWKEQAEVGIFWTCGWWVADDYDMDYLTTENMDNLSQINLHENWRKSAMYFGAGGWEGWCRARCFHVRFGD